MTEQAGARSLFESDNCIQEVRLAAGNMMLCGFVEDALC
jgi:hypothetical protein